ncbi:MAG: hypothetical protein KAV82_11615 [Phycisphaerae bacterium]|nr:hypothetical protein [Phycisphaerae bacterium]
MRIKVELHPDVEAWLLQRRHDWRLIDSFYRRLQTLSCEPISNSEAVSDPRLSRYMLRFSRFGGNDEYAAIFQYDIGRNRIRVLECRKLKPMR